MFKTEADDDDIVLLLGLFCFRCPSSDLRPPTASPGPRRSGVGDISLPGSPRFLCKVRPFPRLIHFAAVAIPTRALRTSRVRCRHDDDQIVSVRCVVDFLWWHWGISAARAHCVMQSLAIIIANAIKQRITMRAGSTEHWERACAAVWAVSEQEIAVKPKKWHKISPNRPTYVTK